MKEEYRGIFKVGDIVRCVHTHPNAKNGTELLKLDEEYTVLLLNCAVDAYNFITVGGHGVSVEGVYDHWFEKVNNKLNNNTMGNFITTFKKITRTEPEKTFVKAGFMDEQENLTEDGVNALQYILWEENEEKLKELATKIIAENEKNITS
jgi:hypothetical protein